ARFLPAARRCPRSEGVRYLPMLLSLPSTSARITALLCRGEQVMKKGIHPNYRQVVFQDVSANFAFLTRSCVDTDETIKWEDGSEYPLYKLDISSASHPSFTGKRNFSTRPVLSRNVILPV